jgi:hypothetical protein
MPHPPRSFIYQTLSSHSQGRQAGQFPTPSTYITSTSYTSPRASSPESPASPAPTYHNLTPRTAQDAGNARSSTHKRGRSTTAPTRVIHALTPLSPTTRPPLAHGQKPVSPAQPALPSAGEAGVYCVMCPYINHPQVASPTLPYSTLPTTAYARRLQSSRLHVCMYVQCTSPF